MFFNTTPILSTATLPVLSTHFHQRQGHYHVFHILYSYFLTLSVFVISVIFFSSFNFAHLEEVSSAALPISFLSFSSVIHLNYVQCITHKKWTVVSPSQYKVVHRWWLSLLYCFIAFSPGRSICHTPVADRVNFHHNMSLRKLSEYCVCCRFVHSICTLIIYLHFYSVGVREVRSASAGFHKCLLSFTIF